MKLHYQGKYNLDPETLPKRKHQPNAVKFKEVSSSKELAVIANTIGLVLMVILSIPILLVYKNETMRGPLPGEPKFGTSGSSCICSPTP